ncbi:MAG TPA: metal-dependent phosphohydrolase [Idiomarina sp.]|nr:HD domain-containing phosphohydrolase [Pseudomonadota bacterium]HAE90103.1 metal-dependent phosphohydrolase [Idiomarina sp.]
MALFTRPDISTDVYIELMDEIKELHQQAENSVIALESAPDSVSHQASLYRAIHTIKGDLGIIGLTPLIPLIGAVENLLDDVRNQRFSFNASMGDIVFNLIDHVYNFVQSCKDSVRVEYPDQRYQRVIGLCQALDYKHIDSALRKILVTLAPELVITADLNNKPTYTLNAQDNAEADLSFFESLITHAEQRSSYWQGRAQRQLKLALIINRHAGSPVDDRQLTAACFVHDFGMSFLPLSILHAKDALSDAQSNTLKTHVYLSAKLLENLPQWQKAKQMVLQHHERVDGEGYPNGLKQSDICDGAKILAIVDTFDAMTHERAHNHHLKRPYSRAHAEIKRLAGTQLCPYWVTVFNEAMTELIRVKRTL